MITEFVLHAVIPAGSWKSPSLTVMWADSSWQYTEQERRLRVELVRALIVQSVPASVRFGRWNRSCRRYRSALVSYFVLLLFADSCVLLHGDLRLRYLHTCLASCSGGLLLIFLAGAGASKVGWKGEPIRKLF